MFNSPFDSFENILAEAKEERDQLDRLLRISTPRERVLVALIAVLLVSFCTWLFLGNVTRNLAVEGVIIEPDKQTSTTNNLLQALVWLESDIAEEIRAGMSATIDIHWADGTAKRLEGQVTTFAPVALPDWSARVESAAPLTMRKVDFDIDTALEGDFRPSSLNATQCRIVIALEKQSPLALFGLRGN